MPNLKAITKSEFSQKTWRRSSNYLFAAKEMACPLAAQELPRAILAMPVGFILVEEAYALAAILGLQSETNFYVDGVGKWLGKYIPAAYRSYPFQLAKNEANKEQLILSIETDCDLVTEQSGDEHFFDDSGEMSKSIAEIFDFLSKLEVSQAATTRICMILQEHKLLKPWELEIQLEAGSHRVDGLYCIDEAALNSLSDKAFVKLRKSGALPVAYCQLLSMTHISELAHLAKIKSKSTSGEIAPELNFDSVTDNGNISFDNL